MENVEDLTPYSRQKETPAIHFPGKRQGFHALQPRKGDPSDTLPWKTSRISRLASDTRRPQRYTSLENVKDFTPYSRQEETPAKHYPGKRRGFHALQPTEGDPRDTLPLKTSRISRFAADRRKPQRYTSLENDKDFTPYSRQTETPTIHFPGKRRGFHALQPTEGDPSDTLP
jgi:hypothetical protein